MHLAPRPGARHHAWDVGWCSRGLTLNTTLPHSQACALWPYTTIDNDIDLHDNDLNMVTK